MGGLLVNNSTERIVIHRVKVTDGLVVHTAKYKGVLFKTTLKSNSLRMILKTVNVSAREWQRQ